MYYIVNVGNNNMAAHLSRSDYEGVLKSAVHPMLWMGLMIGGEGR